ncbi:hypothetical protein Hanom_Chr04g00371621 [Helianthus anomalus]
MISGKSVIYWSNISPMLPILSVPIFCLIFAPLSQSGIDNRQKINSQPFPQLTINFHPLCIVLHAPLRSKCKLYIQIKTANYMYYIE